MAELNGITVRFSDGIKTADYAPPRLYDITANVVLGPNDNFEKVMADTMTAIQRAGYAALHGKKLDVPEAAVEPKEEVPGEAPPRRGRGRPKKEEAEPTGTSAETDTSSATSETATEPANDQPATTADDEWVAASDDIQITDQELLSATSKRAGELGAREPIVKLIATFATRTEGAPFKVQEIPQAQRKDYLAKLAALTA